jgi:hypothetical protein
MYSSTALFVVRKVFFEGQWHLRCIDCGIGTRLEDTRPESLLLRMNGRGYLVSLPEEECETSGIPLGPLSVYGTDELVKAAAIEDRPALIAAQNTVVVVTEDDCQDLELNAFLVMDDCFSIRTNRRMRLEVSTVNELPDCIRELSVDADDELFGNANRTAIRSLPAMLPLPGSINQNGLDVPVVYRIREWIDNALASIDLFICGDYDGINDGQLVERKTRLRHGGEIVVRVGRVESGERLAVN